MSLVEKALKKLQESRDSSASTPRTARRRPPVEPAEAPIATVKPAPVVVLQDETRRTLGRRVSDKIVAVNRSALRAVGLLPPEQQERQIADQYRQVKRPLVAAALSKVEGAPPNARLIMVTSAMPGDGKTFTSINLAISMSMEKDVSVVLVDADVAKPHISRLFGLEQERGLLDALQDETIDVETLILRTDIPGLSILPAGQRSETATELLASQRMEQLARSLDTEDPQRVIIIDSPPLLLTSESRVLAQSVGQIVTVVRAGKTLQREVLDALSHLPQGKSIGLVLNNSVTTTQGYYYGYGDAASTPSQ